MKHQKSPVDDYRAFVESELAKFNSFEGIAKLINDKAGEKITSRHSIRRAVDRWRGGGGSVNLDGDNLEVVSSASSVLNNDDTLLRERGFDPAEWEVTNVTVNEWDSPTGETLKQLKVNARKIKPVNYPIAAREPASYVRPEVNVYRPSKDEGPTLAVFVGDQHAPFHDEVLHAKFCSFLEEYQPSEGVILGDLLDFPDISRHPADPDWSATTQICLDSGYKLLLDYVKSSETTGWSMLAGNHEERLRRSLIDRLPDLAQLKRASIPENDDRWNVASVPYLLRLDELGVNFIGAKGSYDHAQYQVSPYLAARHGWIAAKGSGSSALKTLEKLGHSVVMGHTHRQSIVHKTTTDINNTPSVVAAVESGCMCKIENGLGYTVSPDWQNGWATAELWPDGRFKMDVATYVANNVYWRNERF